MTLIKSILLGSAAGLVAVASAQAADLPTKKAAPAAAYVAICNVAGVTGFTIPGSDTCLKLSGAVQVEVLYAQRTNGAPIIADRFQMDGRAWLTFDVASNTAFGPMTAEAQLNDSVGNTTAAGFGVPGNEGNGAGLDHAWFKWAGLEGHVADGSLFNNGTNTPFINDGFGGPDIGGAAYLAYVAQFGGGFFAGVSIEDPVGHRNLNGGVTSKGTTYPDVAAKIGVSQGWGSASLSAIFHRTNSNDATNYSVSGYGIAGGVNVNVSSMVSVQLSGDYTYGLSKTFSQGLGGSTAVYGTNGVYLVSDVLTNGAGVFGVAKTWGIAGSAKFAVSSQLALALGATYGSLSYTNNFSATGIAGGPNSINAWGVGGEATWKPVTNMSFDLMLNYVKVNVPNASGLLGRLQVTRSF